MRADRAWSRLDGVELGAVGAEQNVTRRIDLGELAAAGVPGRFRLAGGGEARAVFGAGCGAGGAAAAGGAGADACRCRLERRRGGCGCAAQMEGRARLSALGFGRGTGEGGGASSRRGGIAGGGSAPAVGEAGAVGGASLAGGSRGSAAEADGGRRLTSADFGGGAGSRADGASVFGAGGGAAAPAPYLVRQLEGARNGRRAVLRALPARQARRQLCPLPGPRCLSSPRPRSGDVSGRLRRLPRRSPNPRRAFRDFHAIDDGHVRPACLGCRQQVARATSGTCPDNMIWSPANWADHMNGLATGAVI